jgi:hypothetical protein
MRRIAAWLLVAALASAACQSKGKQEAGASGAPIQGVQPVALPDIASAEPAVQA